MSLPTLHFHNAMASPAPGVHGFEVMFHPDGQVHLGKSTDAPRVLVMRMLWLLQVFTEEPRMLEEAYGIVGAARDVKPWRMLPAEGDE
jgi:hypothetical protein